MVLRPTSTIVLRFSGAPILYVVAFVLLALGWLGWRQPLNRAAFWLIGLTFVVHTLALAARIYISGRPPVTNLYSSAVFIGWGAVGLGLVMEAFFRNGLATVIAAVRALRRCVIAHKLAGDGDTFQVLQAVLDTQFWLATHVVCITFGYATTFLAGGLGLLFILRGVSDALLEYADGERIGSHDLRHAVLRDPLQLHRYRSWAGCGRTIPGDGSGDGTPRKTEP